MALSQSLSTGITGLMTHQTAMDNLGNNLANVNTTGFKRGVYQFSNLLHQSIRGGMGADDSTGRGSVNPVSMGMGAQTASINKVFTQGNLENTNNPNDLAINGNGFFVLRQGNGYAYTRAGSFHIGEDRHLTSPEGLYVQGTMAVRQADGTFKIPADAKMQDIVIPIGTVGGHSQTTTVTYSGNLDSTQDLSQGTKLFGKTSFPTVENLQSWMNKDFNGGDNAKADNTWTSLEKETFTLNQSYYDSLDEDVKRLIGTVGNVTVHSDDMVTDLSKSYKAVDSSGAEQEKFRKCDYVMVTVGSDDPPVPYMKDVNGKDIKPGTVIAVDQIDPAEFTRKADDTDPKYLDAETAMDAGCIPMMREVNTINGGNVQTSAAMGIKPPRFMTTGSMNSVTYPKEFFDSTGATISHADFCKLSDADLTKAKLEEIWPDGMKVGGSTLVIDTTAAIPDHNNVFPATLDTPMEDLWYLKGNSWTQPFPNISNGQEVTISFKKGESQLSETFVYNKPSSKSTLVGQTALNQEQSYTLEHFLKFMGGEVNDPMTACQNITPEMFGYMDPEENPTWDGLWDEKGYQDALTNVGLATAYNNLDMTGGVMGLISVPPHISEKNGGLDAYDVPGESAGPFTREGEPKVTYNRTDATGATTKVTADSFYVSLVSNLGEQNALSDIRISYNDIPHESMFSSETDYSAPQGGSSMVSVDYYDSLGNPKSAVVRMSMVSQDNDFTTWRWYADCSADSDCGWVTDETTGEIISSLSVGTGLIRFDKEGNFVKGAEYSETNGITIDQRSQGVNNPIWVKVLNGLSSSSTQDLDFSRMTCTAAKQDFKLYSQNGRAPGTLKEFAVSLDGLIQGLYDNGNTVDLARIGLAQIPNETGMICAGGNLFYTGPASGDALYGHAGTGGLGDIHQSQLETSNVDLSVEFTRLITIERGFQANSRTITTADEMIQELLNLKR